MFALLRIIDLIEVYVFRTAKPAFSARHIFSAEGIIFESQGFHIRIGGDCIDLLFTARTQKIQALRLIHLGIIISRNRAGTHDISMIRHHRMGRTAERRSLFEKLFKEIDPDTCVLRVSVELPRHFLMRGYSSEWLRIRNLQYQYLIFPQRFFGYSMPGLNDICFCRIRRRLYTGGGTNELLDANRIHTVVVSLVYDLEYILRPDQRHGQLNPAGTPASSDRQLSGTKRYLISRYSHCL